ncbi:MAG: class I SAM-dependent methyltransferase [Moraxella sp.]|nr:class I SAM-dependent methyltransferase [Moraxella sp.]
MDRVKSPFGYDADLEYKLDVSIITKMYRDKCGIDLSDEFDGTSYIERYRCIGTGYKFWYPFTLAGDEKFYQKVSSAWENYYKTTRWEYTPSLSYIKPNHSVLEIGCGQGYFLKELENLGLTKVKGLDFNKNAIANKVTKFNILEQNIEDMGDNECYDVICFFQLLEHVPDNYKFLSDAKKLLNEGGGNDF